jgi:hypothetical protein
LLQGDAAEAERLALAVGGFWIGSGVGRRCRCLGIPSLGLQRVSRQIAFRTSNVERLVDCTTSRCFRSLTARRFELAAPPRSAAVGFLSSLTASVARLLVEIVTLDPSFSRRRTGRSARRVNVSKPDEFVMLPHMGGRQLGTPRGRIVSSSSVRPYQLSASGAQASPAPMPPSAAFR